MKDLLIGQQLANFRVERLLGQGGMATVFYGQDVKLQRPVAIKVIDKRYKNDPAYAQRFVNEARMMAKWHHENIIQIYYADDAQGFSYYVMEYVDGQDLSTVMGLYAQDNELMPIADVLRIGTAVARALDYAHRQGVVHRDIKPSNIMIAKAGRVLLGDFGMALEVRDGSMGSIFGTPHYISPEQARRSADAVPQSDLYSLGVILYEILTGSPPFNDVSPASIALQHISEPPPLPRSINPEISASVEAVLLKALEKNPKNRYQSGAALMGALEDAFKSTGSSAKLSLPPLPVGVPTIRRSATSIEQIAKREAPKGRNNTIRKRDVELPPAVYSTNQPQRKKHWGFVVLFLLFLILIGGWYFINNKPSSIINLATQTFIAASPASTDIPAQPTQTLTQPSATPTSTREPATATATAQKEAGTPTLDVNTASTIKYPDGNNFTLFWNDTSFIMLNRSRARRSYSGFAFERLDAASTPTDRFNGYIWFDADFKYLPTKACLNISIIDQNQPLQLNSVECVSGYISTARLIMDKEQGMIFWSTKEGSTQFRVLWLGEEITRCEISAGTCEVFIP